MSQKLTKLTIHGCKNLLENKYFKIYIDLIKKRKCSIPDISEGYCEIHHITPKSIGGDNSEENLVKLTSKEHYVAHHLLTKIFTGNYRIKMMYAFNCMHTRKEMYYNKRYTNEETYERYKKEISEIISKRVKESWHNGSRDKQLAYMKENSPFKIKEIHKKTIETRTKNGTNVWVTNNPMHNEICAEKSISKRRGELHYSAHKSGYRNALTGEYKYFDSNIVPGEEWILQGQLKGKTTKAKGKEKPKKPCDICGKLFPAHTLSRHKKANHQ